MFRGYGTVSPPPPPPLPSTVFNSGASPAPPPAPAPPTLTSHATSTPLPPGDPTIAKPACLSPALLQIAQAMCAAKQQGVPVSPATTAALVNVSTAMSGLGRYQRHRGYRGFGDASTGSANPYAAAIASDPCSWSLLAACATPSAPPAATATFMPTTVASNNNVIIAGILLGALVIGGLYFAGKL